jgi:hypothetical protein
MIFMIFGCGWRVLKKVKREGPVGYCHKQASGNEEPHISIELMIWKIVVRKECWRVKGIAEELRSGNKKKAHYHMRLFGRTMYSVFGLYCVLI